ncbi:MAG: tryptophan RNA-binding attenuation protein [Deltaproteobacteria bacterium]|nr:tryptophan RNA-binding attenuation protein [Deltaproteobacteria bacterium]
MSLPDLETLCWRCWGSGVVPIEDHGQMVECPDCEGLGWIPTEDGRKLLEFVQRHLGITGEDEESKPIP